MSESPLVIQTLLSRPYLTAISTALVVFGAVRLSKGYEDLRKKRELDQTPVDNIGSLSKGISSVHGRAQPLSAEIKATFSEKDCVATQWEIQEYRQENTKRYWKTRATGREFPNFCLKDESGTVAIDPKGAELKLDENDVYQYQPGEKVPEPIRATLETEGIREKELESSGNSPVLGERRFIERRIEPGNELFIYGEAVPNSESDVAASSVEYTISDPGSRTPVYLITDNTRDEVIGSLEDSQRNVILGGALLVAGVLTFLAISQQLIPF